MEGVCERGERKVIDIGIISKIYEYNTCKFDEKLRKKQFTILIKEQKK